MKHRWTTLWALALPLWLVGCSSAPPVAEWRVHTHSASERATEAYLSGHTRVADSDWARAVHQAARSALPEQVARVRLRQCAAQVASLVFTPCPGLGLLQPDMGPELQAYQHYLSTPWQPGDAALQPLLPPSQQPVVRLLGAGAAGTPEAQAAAAAAQLSALQGMADPLSRLVGAAVLLRAGQLSPPTAALAVETASAQGWVRPLLAWLGVQAQWAELAGDLDTARRARRRMDLLAPAPSDAPR